MRHIFMDYADLIMIYTDVSNLERGKSTIIASTREEFFNDHKIIALNNAKSGVQRLLNGLYQNEMVLIDSLESEIIKELEKCNP